MRGLVLTVSLLICGFAARDARAQLPPTVLLPAPQCPGLIDSDAAPAHLEWTAWLSAGAGFGLHTSDASTHVFPNIGIGTEFTTHLAQLSDGLHYGGPVVLRWGPWFNLSTTFDDILGEGGLLLLATQTWHPPWGSYTLRLGAGYGTHDQEPMPHIVLTLTGGVHSFLDRYDPDMLYSCEPIPTHAWGSILRLFATWRVTPTPEPIHEFTFGLELSPTFFAPPYSLMRLGGGPAW